MSEKRAKCVDQKKLKELNERAWLLRISKDQTNAEFDLSNYLVMSGFKVIRADLPEKITGILFIDESDESNPTRIIAINNGEEEAKSRFIAAHEYAHSILHKNGSVQFAHRDYENLEDNEQELEAEAFARCFLMPEQLVLPMCAVLKEERSNLNKKTTRDDIIEFIKNVFNVTVKKAIQRIEELNVCSKLGIE